MGSRIVTSFRKIFVFWLIFGKFFSGLSPVPRRFEGKANTLILTEGIRGNPTVNVVSVAKSPFWHPFGIVRGAKWKDVFLQKSYEKRSKQEFFMIFWAVFCD